MSSGLEWVLMIFHDWLLRCFIRINTNENVVSMEFSRTLPVEKEMATHSCMLARIIPWTEEPGGLQSIGSQRVAHDWATGHARMTSAWKISCMETQLRSSSLVFPYDPIKKNVFIFGCAGSLLLGGLSLPVVSGGAL